MNVWMTRLGLVALLSVVLGPSAFAQTAVLELESEGSTVTINGSGTIFYADPDFNNWNISRVYGTSTSPSVSPFALDLSSLTATNTSGTPSTLEILFSGTGFDVSSSFTTSFNVSLSGGASATESAYLSNSNRSLATTTLIGQVGPFTTTDSGSATSGAAGVPNYSLTLEQVLTDNGGAVSFSTDGNIAPAPASELSTMMLFGTGLLAIGAVLRRKGIKIGPSGILKEAKPLNS
jgi:hypothetical protein